MKFNKRLATICAFMLGATILATSAFADIMLGSGYNSLKNSIKTTTVKLTDEVDNFSVYAAISLKVDDKVLAETTANGKFDIENKAKESVDKSLNKDEIRETYSYSDESKDIYKNNDGLFDVVEKRKNNNANSKLIENPFEEEHVKDAEKVLDALIGSLQDAIQVEESDGKKMYMGNLSETQIPSVVNAISSFAFKYGILDEWNAKRLDVPYPKSNIYVTAASGRAIENEDGIIESGIFTANISAQDSKGIEHIYSLDFSIDIKDINNTVVKAPNLDGQKVTYSKEEYEIDSKYIGKYKNDIVKEEINSFEKVGERFIEITSVKDGNIKGKYYEVYNEGYEPDNVRGFDFYSNYDELNHFIIIHYKNEKGENRRGIIDRRTGSQNINVSFDAVIDEDNSGYSYSNEDGFDNTFIRIFE